MLDRKRLSTAAVCASALIWSGHVVAQTSESAAQTPEAEAEVDVEIAPEDDPANESLAAELTRRHQLKQSFTVQRRVNGEVVETTEETVVLGDDLPSRPTEAGKTIKEQLKDAFDRKALTRTEALAEGKLDFAIGDVDRDGLLNAAEFERLIALLSANDVSSAAAGGAAERESLRASFVSGLEAVQPEVSFETFSGPEAAPIDEKRFTLEFLKVFDGADADADGVLQGDELRAFRSAFAG
ncbi:MAG: hypothetical protein AAFX08_00775 [Pseudomonadota bacterium]